MCMTVTLSEFCPLRSARAIHWMYCSTLIRGPKNTTVSAAVRVIPWAVACGCITNTRGSCSCWNLWMMLERLVGVMPPWMHSLAMFFLVRCAWIVSMLDLNSAKMMTLREVSSKISSSTPRRGAASNSTTSFSSVYTAPQLICNSFDTPAAALTALIVSPAACTSMRSFNRL